MDGLASGRERHALGKSIAQRARRSQRGMEAGWRNALGWTAWLPGGKDTLWERASHRGPEVTKGDGGWVAKRAWVDGLASGRERHALGKASHRGHGGHRGGWRLGGETRLAGRLGFRAGEDMLWGRASHRGPGGHKGGWRLGGETRFGGRLGFWAGKTRFGKEHRTEGTEVTEGGWRLGGETRFGGRLGFWAGKTARFKSLLVPGGRVLNPQSYHSAFRISSTRHEEAFAGGQPPS